MSLTQMPTDLHMFKPSPAGRPPCSRHVLRQDVGRTTHHERRGEGVRLAGGGTALRLPQPQQQHRREQEQQVPAWSNALCVCGTAWGARAPSKYYAEMRTSRHIHNLCLTVACGSTAAHASSRHCERNFSAYDLSKRFVAAADLVQDEWYTFLREFKYTLNDLKGLLTRCGRGRSGTPPSCGCPPSAAG